MYETMNIYPMSWTFDVSFIFLTAFAFLNMVIGIVVLEQEHQKAREADPDVLSHSDVYAEVSHFDCCWKIDNEKAAVATGMNDAIMHRERPVTVLWRVIVMRPFVKWQVPAIELFPNIQCRDAIFERRMAHKESFETGWSTT